MKRKTMMYQQRMIDFDSPATTEQAHVAEATSEPPPVANQGGAKALPLVRPDRQITYGDTPHYEWPAPQYDRDSITVDRIRDDIDGPSHRFLICRGDTVEVFFSQGRLKLGVVTGISHRNREVRVSFGEGSDGIWFAAGCIYPTAEEMPVREERVTPLSEAVATANVEPDGGFLESDRVPGALPCADYSFTDYKKFRQDFAAGTLPYSDYQAQFARLLQSQKAIVSELTSRFKALELAVIASRMGSYDAKRSTKAENAESIYRRMLSSFVLDGTVSYSPFSGETYEAALRRKVQAVTEGEYFRHFELLQEKALAEQKLYENPETLSEFSAFVVVKGEEALNDEKLALYDSLRADIQRELRANDKAKNTVEKFVNDELQSMTFTRKTGYHDKRQCPLHIVQLESRVDREAFNELNRKAKQLGGWYSSFKRDDAGFQFLETSQADRFCELLQGDVDRTDVLTARKERRELSAAEALHELARSLFERADETIAQSETSRQNTARRADIQAGVRGRAYADQAMSRTIHSLAEALSRGEAKYLDSIRFKTQVETLDLVLYRAKWASIRAIKREASESSYAHGRRQDRIENEPVSLAAIRFVEFPYPHLYKRQIEGAVHRGLETRGVKKAAETLKKCYGKADEYKRFAKQYELDALFDFIERAKTAGIDVERLLEATEDYKRLMRANITSLPELRAALREYLLHRAEARGDDPVTIAERELIGKNLPGFFPTPRPVIERMLELADVQPGHKVLEPSCGKGDIIDALKEECPDIEIAAIEQNPSLSDVLTAKGHDVAFGDFLLHQSFYDRIVMNPPFEKGQDIDHVKHAYALLSPGGRLVSVMSEGPFFRSDNKSIEFREWLRDIAAETEPLPEDAFRGVEAFRETSVRTRLVIIGKEG